MSTLPLSYYGVAFFFCAIIHTFCAPYLAKQAHRQKGVWKTFFHLAGEVELTFALWAILTVTFFLMTGQLDFLSSHLRQLNFHEPIFVFLILIFASTRPVLRSVEKFVLSMTRALPVSKPVAELFALLTLGPLCGSLITEPAAMALTAYLLKDKFFVNSLSLRFRYACLAVLFVNISVGGVLTSFAAPPVVMVASTWNWDTAFMLTHFGIASVVAIVLNTICLCLFFKKEIRSVHIQSHTPFSKTDFTLALIHFCLLILLVICAHSFLLQLILFMAFLIFYHSTRTSQSPLKLKEAALVGVFLGGLVFFGDFQKSWLEPVLSKLNSLSIFSLTTLLTGAIDNAAITFLCAKIPHFPEALRTFVVKGAVAGGGLTLIANAPNPAGFAILEETFKKDGFNAIRFFLVALLPTVLVCVCFWFL